MIVPGVKVVRGRNDYSDRDGRKYGIAIHNTSNNASAANEASYATRRTDGISAHFYADDREVIQSIDTKYRTGHAGSTIGNEHAVSVEITGTNAKSRAWWIANVAWDQLGRVLAAVCREYDIEPRRASVAEMKANPKVRAFYSHDDMRRAWGGTTHTDPGDNFPWDYLFAAVKAHLNGTTEEDDMPSAQEIAAAVWSHPIASPAMRVDAKPAADWLKAALGAERTAGQIAAAVAALAGRADVDERQVAEQLAPALLAVLTPQAIAGAIPADLARKVADELARRLAS